MIYPARVREIERTWTENGWQTINPPATPRGRDAASSREPRMAGSPQPLGRSGYGMPSKPRCLNMAAHKLGR
jgi:hypothetical protein